MLTVMRASIDNLTNSCNIASMAVRYCMDDSICRSTFFNLLVRYSAIGDNFIADLCVVIRQCTSSNSTLLYCTVL